MYKKKLQKLKVQIRKKGKGKFLNQKVNVKKIFFKQSISFPKVFLKHYYILIQLSGNSPRQFYFYNVCVQYYDHKTDQQFFGKVPIFVKYDFFKGVVNRSTNVKMSLLINETMNN